MGRGEGGGGQDSRHMCAYEARHERAGEGKERRSAGSKGKGRVCCLWRSVGEKGKGGGESDGYVCGCVCACILEAGYMQGRDKYRRMYAQPDM